jgi:hypothetical protein
MPFWNSEELPQQVAPILQRFAFAHLRSVIKVAVTMLLIDQNKTWVGSTSVAFSDGMACTCFRFLDSFKANLASISSALSCVTYFLFWNFLLKLDVFMWLYSHSLSLGGVQFWLDFAIFAKRAWSPLFFVIERILNLLPIELTSYSFAPSTLSILHQKQPLSPEQEQELHRPDLSATESYHPLQRK